MDYEKDHDFPESFVVVEGNRYDLTLFRTVKKTGTSTDFTYYLCLDPSWPYRSAIFNPRDKKPLERYQLVYISLGIDDNETVIVIRYFFQNTSVHNNYATPIERDIGKGLGKIVMCYVVNYLKHTYPHLQYVSLMKSSMRQDQDMDPVDVDVAREFLHTFCDDALEGIDADDDVMFVYHEARNNVVLEIYYYKNFGLLPRNPHDKPCDSKFMETTIENLLQHCELEELPEIDIFEHFKVSNPSARGLRSLLPWIGRNERSRPSQSVPTRVTRSIGGRLRMKRSRRCR
jgi:hypothetical protein